ncbi:MAG TPA: rRNA maturation RNase YbeY [Syntrophomonadaceae bacterium]|nr:rRNA maturation RNase YbeY [Syntrophomonadaceae bacterium]
MQLLISEEQSQVDVGSEIRALIREALENLLREEEFSQEFIDAAEVSMIFIDDQKMAVLNERYRGFAGTTDVLSFPMMGDNDGIDDLEVFQDELLLGDIVISVPRALEQAQEYGHSFAQEMLFLAVHGMLHLLGYDHQIEADAARMRSKEKKILKMVDLSMELD